MLYVLGSLLVLLLSLYGILQLSSTQTWLTRRIAGYLSSRLHTRVEVKGVDIDFMKKLVLEGVYVEDLHRDTLLYAGKLKVDISSFSLDKNIFYFNLVRLEDTRFYLKTYKNETALNLDFILKEFASTDTSRGESAGFYLKRSRLELDNISFRLENENLPRIPFGVDYAHMHVEGLSGRFTNLFIADGTFLFRVRGLTLRERSGFYLQELSSDFVRLSSTEMYLLNLKVKTPDTEVRTDLRFTYSTWSDFKDFNNKVMMNAELGETRVSMADIAYFAPALKGMQNPVSISGEVKGTVSKLKGKNLRIGFGRDTRFLGNITMRGLPNIDETFIEFSVDSLRTNKRDIESIPLPPFDKNHFVQLPDNFASLGTLRFKGKFNGFLNDFVAYGHLKSDLGELTSDLNLKYEDKMPIVYSGHLESKEFDAGKLLNQPYLGRITLNADVKGSGLRKENAAANVQGTVTSIDLYKYTYKNISIKGEIAKGLFSGRLGIDDSDIRMEFSGNVNLNPRLPEFDFTTTIHKARLKKLYLSDRDSTSMLAATVSARFSGSSIDNLSGTAEARDVVYTEKGKRYTADRISVSSSGMAGGKVLSVSSDYVDGSLKGAYRLEKLWPSLQQLLSGYVNNLYPSARELSLPRQSFSFSFRFRNTDELSDLFLPSLKLAENTEVSGHFDSENLDFSLDASSPSLLINTFRINNFRFTSKTEDNRIRLSSGASSVLRNDSTWLRDFTATAESNKNGFTFATHLANADSAAYKADILARVVLKEEKNFYLAFLPESDVVLQGKKWMLNKNNSLVIDTSAVKISELGLYNEDQQVDIGGTYVYRPSKAQGPDNARLVVSFTNFRLAIINQFIKTPGTVLNGSISGKANVYSNPSDASLGFSSNLKVDRLYLNKDSLGTATIVAAWDEFSKIMSLTCNIARNDIRNVELKGQYHTSRETDYLDFDLTLQKISLPSYSNYLKAYITDLRGFASAKLHIGGSFDEPSVTGSLRLQRTSFILNYLGTLYSLSDEFTITDSYIGFDEVTINDIRGNKAIASGKLYHNHFRDFRFDIGINAKKFQCLNTTASQNSQYYGTAYATGVVDIFGTTDDLLMNIAMKSEKGTQINIPLSNPEEVGDNNFVKFISKAAKTTAVRKEYAGSSGLQMDFDLEVTPDAEIQLIFDSKIGDVIKGSGNGNINMSISSFGDFQMYGDYMIESGEYLFTLQNIINKKFTIEKGGTIRWNGNPTDAEINLSAVYRLKTSLYDLIPREEYKNKLPVECKLLMSNKLFNPNIRFDIVVPNVDEFTSNSINQALGKNEQANNQQLINQQIFNLLVFNRFIPPNGSNNDRINSGLTANTTELLSNQVSNWTSQLSNQLLGKDINIGFNYRPVNADNQRELDLAYSTQLFNDRVVVNGNVGRTYNQNTSNIVGDFNVEYKFRPDGKLRLKAFNRMNNNIILNNGQLYTQGFGIFYREEFGTFRELIEKYRKKKLLGK
jgi:hypothetical protein